jgi:hypothetical protein
MKKTSHFKLLCLIVTGLFLPPFEAVHLVFVQSLSERFFSGCSFLLSSSGDQAKYSG